MFMKSLSFKEERFIGKGMSKCVRFSLGDVSWLFEDRVFKSSDSRFGFAFEGKLLRYVKNVFNDFFLNDVSFVGKGFYVNVGKYEVFYRGLGWNCTCEFFSAWRGSGDGLCWHILKGMVIYEFLRSDK